MNVMSRNHLGSTKPVDLSLRYELVDVGGKKVAVTTNPDPASGVALGPLAGDGSPQFKGQVTISCQPNGTLEARPGVVLADFELPSVDGAGSVVFWPGQAYLHNVDVQPVSVRGTCYKFPGALNIPENK